MTLIARHVLAFAAALLITAAVLDAAVTVPDVQPGTASAGVVLA